MIGKKKDIKKIVTTVILVLVAFVLVNMIAYKTALLLLNRPLSGDNYKTLKTKEEDIIILKKNTNNLKKYLNLNYPTLEDGFEFSKDRSSEIYNTYYLYASDGLTLNATFRVGIASDYIETISKLDNTIGYDYNKKLLEDNNIINNFDVIDYLNKEYNVKTNFFAKKEDIRLKYVMDTFANTKLTKGKFYNITGDITGYMIVSEDNSKYEVNIKDGYNYYAIEFGNASLEYYTYDYVVDFISKIFINNED